MIYCHPLKIWGPYTRVPSPIYLFRFGTEEKDILPYRLHNIVMQEFRFFLLKNVLNHSNDTQLWLIF